MFLLNLIALALYEFLTGVEYISTLEDSKLLPVLFVAYMAILWIGDINRAFD